MIYLKLLEIIIFKIVFDTSNYWVLGKIFLAKYMFSFDEEDKKIYFYNKNYGDNGEIDLNNHEKNNYLIIQVISIIIGIIIFSILGFFIGKFFYNKKKIITHELDDIEDENFIYNNTNNIQNKLSP